MSILDVIVRRIILPWPSIKTTIAAYCAVVALAAIGKCVYQWIAPPAIFAEHELLAGSRLDADDFKLKWSWFSKGKKPAADHPLVGRYLLRDFEPKQEIIRSSLSPFPPIPNPHGVQFLPLTLNRAELSAALSTGEEIRSCVEKELKQTLGASDFYVQCADDASQQCLIFLRFEKGASSTPKNARLGILAAAKACKESKPPEEPKE